MELWVPQFVRRRAGHRCEYCHLPQEAAPWLTFHIDHIRARQHGGNDDPLNLSLACPDCNSRKGPNLTSVAPASDTIVPIFNPRLQEWEEHFMRLGPEIVGLTDIGSATVQLLNMNEEERVVMRAELIAEGIY